MEKMEFEKLEEIVKALLEERNLDSERIRNLGRYVTSQINSLSALSYR